MKKDISEPHIVLFVEGDTDKIFFDALLDYYRRTSSTPTKSCEVKNLGGVTRYTSKVVAKLRNEIIPGAKKRGLTVMAVCCSYDTDVFTDATRPIVAWPKVRREIKSLGISNFITIEVEESIEDWLLDDLAGISAYLHLKSEPTPKGRNGYERLMSVYRKANKVYVKGISAAELITALDIALIRKRRSASLRQFEQLLGVRL